MEARQVFGNGSTPAWISAGAAVVVCVIAAWSMASSPSQDMLDDHERRIRGLEQLTAQQLSSIDARLAAMRREIARLRDDGDG